VIIVWHSVFLIGKMLWRRNFLLFRLMIHGDLYPLLI
jgi:hypothetical protein